MGIKVAELKRIFDDFSADYSAGSSLKPLPYSTYKALARFLSAHIKEAVELEFEFNHSAYETLEILITVSLGQNEFVFSGLDHSFGEYLMKKLEDKAVENTMNCLSTINSGITYSDISTSDTYISTNRYSNMGTMDVETIKCKTLEADEIIIKEKEGEKMKGFNFDFGPCDGNKVHMSVYGLAIKNAAGTWVSYDEKNEDIIDVDILNFDAGKFMYKMPVALKDVKVGDVLIHNKVPMFVTYLNENSFTVIDVYAGEEKVILPTKNMFGFNFVTKVVSFLDMSGMSADTPFGNMLPLILMGDNKDIDPMLFMMMNGNGNFDMSNPMMMYFMMKDNKTNDMLPLLMAMAPKPHCGKNAACDCGNPLEKA